MLKKLLGYQVMGAAVTESYVTKFINDIFASVGKFLTTVGKGLTGLGTMISVVILVYLIFKAIMDTKSGNPEAWKESAGRIGVVAVLMIVLAVRTLLI